MLTFIWFAAICLYALDFVTSARDSDIPAMIEAAFLIFTFVYLLRG